MRKLDRMVLMAKNILERTVQDVVEKAEGVAQAGTEQVMMKKDGDGNVIVVAILLVVAIALCVTFRTAIQGWLTTLVTYFENDLKVFTIPNS